MLSTIAVGCCMAPTIISGDVLHWDYSREPKNGDIVLAVLVRNGQTYKIAKYLDYFGSSKMLRSETGLTPLIDDDQIVAVLDRIERPESITPEMRALIDDRQHALDEYESQHDDELVKYWSLFRLDTGALTGSTLAMKRGHLAGNIPPGCGVTLGKFNHETHRVNLQTKEVEEIPTIACSDIADNAATSVTSSFSASVSWTTTTTDLCDLAFTPDADGTAELSWSFLDTGGNTTYTVYLFENSSLIATIGGGYISGSNQTNSGIYTTAVTSGNAYDLVIRGYGTVSGTNSVAHLSTRSTIVKK